MNFNEMTDEEFLDAISFEPMIIDDPDIAARLIRDLKEAYSSDEGNFEPTKVKTVTPEEMDEMIEEFFNGK